MTTSGASLWADPGSALDVGQLQLALQRGWTPCASGGHVLEDLRVLKSRRSSSRHKQPHPLTLCLEVTLRCANGSRLVQQLYGKAYRDGASAQALDRARQSASAAPGLGDAVAHVPELDMLLWAWPNDPVLQQLPQLLGPAVLPHLPASMRQPGTRLISSDVLRYEPEHRATLRLRVQAPGPALPDTLYAKTFCDDRAVSLHERFTHFWRHAAADPAAPQVAEPLGFDAATRTLWQAPAPGQALSQRLHTASAAQDLANVGRALAYLHACGLPADNARPLSHWLTEIGRRQMKIARAAPQLAARAQAVQQQLRLAAERLPVHEPGLIHGDFHPDQIWIDGGRVVLFDFDEFSLGHPMEDLAAFCVKLEQLLPSPSRSQALTSAVISGYCQAAPHRFCATALAWHCAVQSLLQTSRAFVFQVPGWQDVLCARLARTEQRVEETMR